MNVLMVGAGSPPTPFIARQVQALREQGIRVGFFQDPSRFPVLSRWLCAHGFIFHLGGQALQAARSADLIHYQWPGHWLAYHGLARFFKKKSVLSMRGRQINIQPFLPLQESYVHNLRRWLPLCTAYHSVSRALVRQAEVFGVDAARTRVIYTAVDTQFFCPSLEQRPELPLQIVMVGAMIWRKGYEYALLAFQQLLQTGVAAVLTIIGDGEERDRIQYTLGDLGIESSVRLLGKLSPEQVRDQLQRSDIYLHTALSEGIANGVIEAMACGLPVVVADSGGMAEALTDGQEGFLVSTRQPQATAQALYTLSQSKEQRLRMGLAGRGRVERDFTLERQGREFMDFYSQVLRSP